MADIRKIRVAKTVIEEYVVNVEEWFNEYSREWEHFLMGDEPTEDDKQEFIAETANELAHDEYGLGTPIYTDVDFDVEIY